MVTLKVSQCLRGNSFFFVIVSFASLINDLRLKSIFPRSCFVMTSIVRCALRIKLNQTEGANCLSKQEGAKRPQRKLQILIKDQRKGNVVLLHVLIKGAEGISLGNMVHDNRMLIIPFLPHGYRPNQKNEVKCFPFEVLPAPQKSSAT